MFKSAPQQKLLRERAAAKMEKHLRKPGLLDALKPNFAVGCRRTTPGLRYMESLNAANVDVHLASVTEVTEDGLVAADGSRVIGLDTIIFATGFDTTYKPHFKIVGRDNVTLAEKFDPNPDSYLSFGVPGMFCSHCLNDNLIHYSLQASPTMSCSSVPHFPCSQAQ